MRSLLMPFCLWLFPAAFLAVDKPPNPPGLLFYLSAEGRQYHDRAPRGPFS